MANQGSGLGKGPDPAMKDRTSYDARSGAAKRPQTDFPTKWGMQDQTGMNGAGPGKPGSGPDASSPKPFDLLSARERGKSVEPKSYAASWGMRDADGKGVDPAIGGKVMAEAVVGGAHLPGSVAKPGPAPKRAA